MSSTLQSSGYEAAKVRFANHEVYEPRRLARCLQAVVDHCPRGARVLDIGCGSGRIMLALREQKQCDCKGMDLAPGALTLAKTNGLDVICGDVDQPDGEISERLSQHYDVVVLSKCLPYLKSKNVLMENLSTDLIFIYDRNHGSLHYRWERLRGRAKRYDDDMRYRTKDGRVFSGSTLTISEARRWAASYSYDLSVIALKCRRRFLPRFLQELFSNQVTLKLSKRPA